MLPDDLVVWRLRAAPAGFDARFAAIWRRYVYRLAEPSAPVHPLYREWSPGCDRELDLDRLNAAAGACSGCATSARSAAAVRAGRRSVPCSTCGPNASTAGPLAGVIECTVRADAFCHSMVRSLVGALVEVGAGRRDVAWLEAVTAARRPRPGGAGAGRPAG